MRAVWKIVSIVKVAALLVGAGAFWLIRPPEIAEGEAATPTAVVAPASMEEMVSHRQCAHQTTGHACL